MPDSTGLKLNHVSPGEPSKYSHKAFVFVNLKLSPTQTNDDIIIRKKTNVEFNTARNYGRHFQDCPIETTFPDKYEKSTEKKNPKVKARNMCFVVAFKQTTRLVILTVKPLI